MKLFAGINLIVLMLLFSGAGHSTAAADLTKKKQVIINKESSGYSLGVLVKFLSADEKKEYNLEEGALVIKVVEGSAAEEAGLLKDDIIVGFDGQKISDPETLNDLIDDIDEPRTVKIDVYRNGKNLTVSAALKEKAQEDLTLHLEDEDFEEHFGEITRIAPIIEKKIHHFSQKGAYLGVHAKNISDQLKEYFEVEGGVLIEKVIEDSPAEKAGLKAGDIILKIEDKDIEDYGDLVRVLNYYDPGDELSIVYSRKGSKKTIKVVVDKKEGAFPNLRWIQEGSLPEIMEEMPILEEELEQLKDLEQELDDIKVDIKVLYI